MHHSEMKGNVDEQPGKSNIDSTVQEKEINVKELTESIETKIIENNNNNNNMKKGTQCTQAVNARDNLVVALSTDQVDPCETQLLPTESKLKDEIQEEEQEIKIKKPIEIIHAQKPNKKKNKENLKRHNQNVMQPTIPPPLSLKNPASNSNESDYDQNTVINTSTASSTISSTTTTTATSTIEEDGLPIDKHRETILSHIKDNRVTIVQGGTGCGKSSRLPVVLLEDSESQGLPCRIMVSC
jgi:hypothetical protein